MVPGMVRVCGIGAAMRRPMAGVSPLVFCGRRRKTVVL